MELWVIDDINTFPRKVVDLPGNGDPGSLINIDNDLYFVSYGIRQLFRYNVATTGTNAINSQNEVSVYPTNVKERFSIKSEGTVKSVELFNISGQSILKKMAVNTVNVNNLKGMYFVKVELIDGTRSVHKILVE